MKFGSELQYECPDNCPKDCTYIEDMRNYGQNSICCRCPVLICKEPVTEEDEMYMPVVPASQFRDDWAKEWHNFFKNGREPYLYIWSN